MFGESAKLFVVATPIGHLDDFTFRARDILRQVKWIAAEDTRRSSKLLNHYMIDTPLLALHEHNESKVAPQLVSRLLQGESGALISDAGTPLISDPGHVLVREAIAAGIDIVPIPGASSIVAALSVAGLPAIPFIFEGFLPAKAGARRSLLQTLKYETRTMVFFEAPHRLVESLADCVEAFGAERPAAVARELTKIYETVHRGGLEALHQAFLGDEYCRGEMVLVVQGSQQPVNTAESERIALLLVQHLPVKQAASLTAQISGRAKNEVYAWLLQQRAEPKHD